MWVADAEAVNQITTRRNDFPKPTELYGSVDLFGKNVVSTEGSVWRHHRKISSPPFTEKNNLLVFKESIRQAQSMISSWVTTTDQSSKTLPHIAEDTMRLSLHVISRAGFGQTLKWPHEEAGEVVLPKGHILSYKDALESLLQNIIQIMLMPKVILCEWKLDNIVENYTTDRLIIANSPFKSQKVAKSAYAEWGQYMNELLVAKKEDIRQGKEQEGMDLMGQSNSYDRILLSC